MIKRSTKEKINIDEALQEIVDYIRTKEIFSYYDMVEDLGIKYHEAKRALDLVLARSGLNGNPLKKVVFKKGKVSCFSIVELKA